MARLTPTVVFYRIACVPVFVISLVPLWDGAAAH
jgi:hypothetical protein